MTICLFVFIWPILVQTKCENFRWFFGVLTYGKPWKIAFEINWPLRLLYTLGCCESDLNEHIIIKRFDILYLMLPICDKKRFWKILSFKHGCNFYSKHIVQSNRVVLGLTRLREMARLTVWSVNKARCMAIAVLCV